jgi:ATP-dependent RNA helicase RhlE
MQFVDLELIPPLLRAVREEGYESPTPIQEQAIPPILAGRDVLGCAQTGTGKTAAFALPILQRLAASPGPRRGRRPIRALVLTPTRELAAQIGESFATYGRHLPLTHTVIFGGVNQRPQALALERGIDVLVATPGRLLDLHGQGLVDHGRVEVFVLDEADRMLDMGFVHDVRRVVATIPARRQTLLFSATMPQDILELAATVLTDPVDVAVAPPATTVELVEQSVYFVEKKEKRELLEHLLEDRSITRTLVFSRTKHGANRIVKNLAQAGVVALAIHGNKSQGARERALEGFKRGEVRVLVATDLAARGLDVEDITHVINYDIPNVPETYVHRIGRTARAGATGRAISFCEEEERPYLVDVQRLIGQHVPVVEDHPFPSPRGVPPPPDLRPARRPRGGAPAAPPRSQPAAPERADGRPRRRRASHSAGARRAARARRRARVGAAEVAAALERPPSRGAPDLPPHRRPRPAPPSGCAAAARA